MIFKTYSELIKFPTFKERYEYLKLDGKVGGETFGKYRYLNQQFYLSNLWKSIRRKVILRDCGCDLACQDRPIFDGVEIFIHHMNAVTVDDFINKTDKLTNPEYLITTTYNTHNAIHYGNYDIVCDEMTIRTPYDTCPWKRK